MLWLILFGRTLQVSAHFKLKLAVAVAVAVLDFGLGGDKSDGAFCQSIRDELRGAFYNCGPALIRARSPSFGRSTSEEGGPWILLQGSVISRSVLLFQHIACKQK